MSNYITRKNNFLEDLEARGFTVKNFGQTMVLYSKKHTETSALHLTENILRDGYRLDGVLVSIVDGEKTQTRLTTTELEGILS